MNSVASVKSDFQDFVPMISTLKTRHVLEDEDEDKIKVRSKRRIHNNSRICYEIKFVQFDCSNLI